jgi:ligand-binding SRPBCC domain-containing protein
MSYHAQFEHWIAAPLEKVFAFFADPMNLPGIMPARLEIRFEEMTVVAPPAGAPAHFAGEGTKFVASYRALPFFSFRIRSEVEIVGFVMNEFFADVQTRGPFRSWHHRHEFASETRGGVPGTHLRDLMEYEVGIEPLGSAVNALFIGPQMRRTFAYRQVAVERIFGSQGLLAG